MIRVILVDDHEMVRLGLSAFLSTQEDMDVCGQASNGKEGIALAKVHRPDVVLMDLVMDEMDGIEATATLTKELPETKVIVLTSYIEDEKVYPVIEAGAFSYLLKTSSAATIADAIRRASAGEAFIEAQVTSKMMAKMREKKSVHLHEELTARELDVLKLIGDGKTNAEIAEMLYIGVKTVKTHVSHILQKLELEDRTQIAIYAHRHDLVQ